MEKVKIGINGFGRIGRAFTRIAIEGQKQFEIEVINTRKTPPEMLAYLLKYDSVYGRFKKDVSFDEEGIIVDGKKIYATRISDPKELTWKRWDVDIVIDATGVFKTRQELENHLKNGAKKVILTAPTSDPSIPHVVLGANDDQINLKEVDILSNASCTTNCAALMFKILDEKFGLISGFLTTTHAYTSSQSLLDNPKKTFTRSRAASLSLIPTTTGAAKAIAKVLPSLAGKIDAMAIRAPIPVVSFSDISAVVSKTTSVEEINHAFKEAANKELKGILAFEEAPLVSSDFVGSPFSCIFDSNYTKVIQQNLVKVFGWYDNEWGYSARLVDLTEKIASLVA